ncbi:MAG: C4-dicarboxylate transporter DcuC [Campylobacter sp.]|nr:C4-dicarboxylate transporter DcuC [Campylobacter sp.]
METFRIVCAILGIVAVVALLIKKFETRTVLVGVGLVLCIISLEPMSGLKAFTDNMVRGGLIKAICASMGFAYVMKFTGCDQHLVRALTAPLRNVGLFLVPLTVVVTFFINIAIPSAAGCSAAVGATLIPLLMAAGIKPEMAGASVLAGTFGAVLSPGSAHNIFVTEMVQMSNPVYTVQDVIKVQFSSAMISLVIVLVCITVAVFIFRDYQKGLNFNNLGDSNIQESKEPIKVHFAIMPLIPLVILIIGGTSLSDISWLAWTKMGVAEAMLIGAIVAIAVTLTNPQTITKEFFNGMGSAYANVIGIIIAAGVFVAGLGACGAIDAIIDFLKNEQSYVKFGGTFIPFLMAVVTGSGDAAAFAFNEAVTSQAIHLGFAQDKLGMAVAISGALGRSMSPIAGACIVCAGLAKVSPIQIAKRTAIGMIFSVLAIAFFIL